MSLTVLPRTPPLPHPTCKAIVGRPAPRLRRAPPVAVNLITRRDNGFGSGIPRVTVGKPGKPSRRIGRSSLVSSPVTPYPFTRPMVGKPPRRNPAQRRSVTVRTPFNPLVAVPRIIVGKPAQRAPKAPPRSVTLRSPAYAQPLPPRVIVGRHPITPFRRGKAVLNRSAQSFPALPRVTVGRPPKGAGKGKPAVTLSTKWATSPPRPIQVVLRPPLIRRVPPKAVMLQTGKGGQPGSTPIPRVLVGKRPAPVRRAPVAKLNQSSGLSGGSIPIPKMLVSFTRRTKPKPPKAVFLRTLPASPIGTSPRPRVLYGLRPRVVQKPGKSVMAMQTPRTASGLPLDLPDAVCQWLINQPRFVTAFAYNAQTNECISADWDDPGGPYPFVVYREPMGDKDYESQGGWEEDAQFEMAVLTPSKTLSRELGKIVGQILNDAPLEFVDGSVFYFRWRNPAFPPVHESGKLENTWVWRRILLFDYKVEGHMPS